MLSTQTADIILNSEKHEKKIPENSRGCRNGKDMVYPSGKNIPNIHDILRLKEAFNNTIRFEIKGTNLEYLYLNDFKNFVEIYHIPRKQHMKRQPHSRRAREENSPASIKC